MKFIDPWGHEIELTEEQAQGRAPIVCFHCGRESKLEDNRAPVQRPQPPKREDEV